MMDQETRERLERAKKLLARAPTKTEATTEALEKFRAWRERLPEQDRPECWRPE